MMSNFDKIKFSLFLLIFLTLLAHVNGQGIEFFHGTFEEALTKAAADNKMIFVDCYTTWCGPCKAMAKNTFTQPEVGDFHNKNFINLKLDMEQEEGVKFGHKYPVSAYPTLYYINDKGDVVKKLVGGQKPEGLIQAGKIALQSDDRSGDYEEAYNDGNRDYELVYNYVKALNNVGKPSLQIANDYLNSKPEISKEQRLQFLFEAAVESDSKLFEEMIQQKEDIIAIVGDEKYKEKVEGACRKTVQKAIEYEVEMLLNEAIEKNSQALGSSKESPFVYESKMTYYKSFNKDQEYLDAAENYVKYLDDNHTEIAKIAVAVCKDLDDKDDAVKSATKWAKKAYKSDDSQSVLESYIKVLFAAKDYKDAIKTLKKAIDDAEKKAYNKQVLESMLKFAETQV